MKTKLKAVETLDAADAAVETQVPEFSEELPPYSVDPKSFDARVAGIEECSVTRELSRHWSCVTAYQVERAEERGEVKTFEERQELLTKLWQRKWEPKDPEKLEDHIKYIKRKAARRIDWGDIGQLWNASPRDAIELWRAIRLEARDEFFGGHYAARSFEVGVYDNETWRRAQYLAIRDGLIEEWKPRGAGEFILIDQMVQFYTMQLYWTEEAMKRASTEPRLETYEYTEWKRHRNAQDKAMQWTEGAWNIPYQHQADAVEQAFRIVDLCAKSFQRAARQLANIRLVRAKELRTRRRDRQRALRVIGSTRG